MGIYWLGGYMCALNIIYIKGTCSNTSFILPRSRIMEWMFWYSHKMGIFLFFTLMHVSRLEKLLAVIHYVEVPAWKMTELETSGCKWYFNVAATYCPELFCELCSSGNQQLQIIKVPSFSLKAKTFPFT